MSEWDLTAWEKVFFKVTVYFIFANYLKRRYFTFIPPILKLLKVAKLATFYCTYKLGQTKMQKKKKKNDQRRQFGLCKVLFKGILFDKFWIN